MRIWVIGRGYPTVSNKMWGSFELEQAKLLERNGYNVTFIALTLSFFNRKDPRGLRVFEDNGVKVFTYSHFYFPGKVGVYLEKFEDKCWRNLFEKAEKESGMPDIIHVHYPSMVSSINEIEKYRNRGVRLYVTEHWSRVLTYNLKSHELNRLKYYTTHANCFASVSEILQKAVKRLVSVTTPMEVIPNIVSPFFFNAKGKRNDDSFTFITVGRLVPLKQFDEVINVFLKEFSGNNIIRLKLIGTGEQKNYLKQIAGNNPQISFLGELSLEKTAYEIANANALISFSKYETFATPVAEAWACGKPVIVSNNSGVAAFVRDDNGRVVFFDSPEMLGVTMREIYDSYTKYDSCKISAFARECFNDNAIMKMLDDMYSHY